MCPLRGLPTGQWAAGCPAPAGTAAALPSRALSSTCIPVPRPHCPRYSPPPGSSRSDSCSPPWKAQEGLGTPGRGVAPPAAALGPCPGDPPAPVTPLRTLSAAGSAWSESLFPGRRRGQCHSGLLELRGRPLGAPRLKAWVAAPLPCSSPDCVRAVEPRQGLLEPFLPCQEPTALFRPVHPPHATL